MMKPLYLLLFCIGCLSAVAQPKPMRQQSYWPEGNEIVCVNGTNRYTRALYGSHSLFRLETSDRPVFATFDKRHNRNVRFWLVNNANGQTLALDSTTYCKAYYKGGVRRYELRDASWGGGVLTVEVIASLDAEQALWRFTAKGFADAVSLSYAVAPTRRMKMARDGDLGLEPRESYDADPHAMPVTGRCSPDDCLLLVNGEDSLRVLGGKRGQTAFEKELNAIGKRMSRLEFSTPDPYLNPIGRNLVAATDGMWDGETWLHGCIGWRMPLPGWRAAYAGDVTGWTDRAERHFNAYAESQVTGVPPVYPHPTQDEANNLARGVEKWGTQMYSDGYICRSPHNNHQMHHYDMNLSYIDELLWHFSYDADTAYMRRMWPVLTRHLAWEKRNWDPDGDHLYDAYCCIWASDALWYNGGAVTHSSAYNYRANLLAARIAELIGEDGRPYREEANAILEALNSRLWLSDAGHWAEYQDLMGLRRLHRSAALWTIYTPIDCGACSPEQAWCATAYVERSIPHIPVTFSQPREEMPRVEQSLYTLSTTDWLPYDWSTNNVAHEEVMNMALAFFEAGRNEAGYRLLKADVMDGMYLGQSPGNFGQISYYDKARAEAYRDFADNIGITSRAMVCGLFGVRPDALYGQCIVQPGFPERWDSASFHAPYLSYRYKKQGNKMVLRVAQRFSQPLKIVFRYSLGDGRFAEVEGTADSVQTLVLNLPMSKGGDMTEQVSIPVRKSVDLERAGLLADRAVSRKQCMVKISYNARVDKVFQQEYRSPRPPYTSLEIPKQGIGQWCQPKRMVALNDSGFRAKITDDIFRTPLGVDFASPKEGDNICFTSLFDNYPDSVVVPLKGKARRLWLLMAGTTNNMQSRIDNAIVTVTYQDGSCDTLHLENPINWCPVEQDYYVDGLAFQTAPLRPYRVHLGSGLVSRDLYRRLHLNGITRHVAGNADSAEPNIIPDGAAEILSMKLDGSRRLKHLCLRTLSNEVVVGLMAATLER